MMGPQPTSSLEERRGRTQKELHTRSSLVGITRKKKAHRLLGGRRRNERRAGIEQRLVGKCGVQGCFRLGPSLGN